MIHQDKELLQILNNYSGKIDPNQITSLLEQGADPNIVNARNENILHFLARVLPATTFVDYLTTLVKKYHIALDKKNNAKQTPYELLLANKQMTLSLFKLFHSFKHDVYETDQNGNTYLHQVVQEQPLDFAKIEHVLEHMDDATKPNNYGLTPLQLLLNNKSLKELPISTATSFFKKKASQNTTDVEGNNVLYYLENDASTKTYNEFIETWGIKIPHKNIYQEDVIAYRIRTNNLNYDLFCALYELGYDINTQYQQGKTYSHLLVDQGNFISHILKLLRFHPDTTVKDSEGFTTLNYIMVNNICYPHLLNEFCKVGADPLTQDHLGRHFLDVLIDSNGHINDIRDTLALYKRYNVPASVIEACYKKVAGAEPLRADVALLFTEFGVDIDMPIDDNENTLLIHAIMQKKPRTCIQKILAHKATANKKNKSGQEALNIYINQEDKINFDTLLLLLNHGASGDCKDNHGRSLYWLGIDNKMTADIATNLINAGIDINSPRNNEPFSNHPIDILIQSKIIYRDLIALMVKKGVELNVYDKQGYTPMHRIIKKGDAEFVRSLELPTSILTLQDKNPQSLIHYTVEEMLNGKPEYDQNAEDISKIKNSFNETQKVSQEDFDFLQRVKSQHVEARILLLDIFYKHKAPGYYISGTQDKAAISLATELDKENNLYGTLLLKMLKFNQTSKGNYSERQACSHQVLTTILEIFITNALCKEDVIEQFNSLTLPFKACTPQSFALLQCFLENNFDNLDRHRDRDKAGFKSSCQQFKEVLDKYADKISQEKLYPEGIINTISFIAAGVDISFQAAQRSRRQSAPLPAPVIPLDSPYSPYLAISSSLGSPSATFTPPPAFNPAYSGTPPEYHPNIHSNHESMAPQATQLVEPTIATAPPYASEDEPLYPQLDLPNYDPPPPYPYAQRFTEELRQHNTDNSNSLNELEEANFHFH